MNNNDILDDFLDIFKFQINETQSKISLFDVLTPRNMNKFYSSVVKMKFCRGQFVYKEDEMPTNIYYIIHGQIEVCVLNYIIITYVFKLALMTNSMNQQQKEKNKNETYHKMRTNIRARKITVIPIKKNFSLYFIGD